jgi:16S rRNA (guanine1207-N2)-methyltransferase
VANRHLPYEADLDAAFRRVRLVEEVGGYKVYEATK